MSSKAQLLKELDDLVAQAEKQVRMFKSSRDLLYINLSQTYLWWAKANKVKGLLDSLYKQHNLKTNATDGEEKFTRVLRLVWRLDWADTSKSLLQPLE